MKWIAGRDVWQILKFPFPAAAVNAEENSCLMGIQDRFSCPVFVLESSHDEDTEVVSDTENESREDNIDNVEFDTQNPHQAQNNGPA